MFVCVRRTNSERETVTACVWESTEGRYDKRRNLIGEIHVSTHAACLECSWVGRRRQPTPAGTSAAQTDADEHNKDSRSTGEPMEPQSLIALAREIATKAHAGQVDKTGHDYITHPLRVAERVSATFPEAPAGVIAAALLHDVVEDTGRSDVDLVAAGIPRDVVDAVLAVTKRDHEPAELYFARVRANPWAVMVKTADNTDPDRVAQLDQPTRERLKLKYSRARALLAGDTGL